MPLDRRSFMKIGMSAALGLAVAPARAHRLVAPGLSSTGRHRFKVGAFDAVAVNDGDMIYRASQYFTNAPADQLARALAARDLQPDSLPSPFTCLFVRTDTHNVLIDTGAGSLADTVGHLLRRLEAEIVHPDDIDTVVLTHAHPDHIGGVADVNGVPLFPNAEFVMDEAEWAFWTDESKLASVGDFFARVARHNLTPIRDRMRLVRGETEIVPGLRVVAAPGHTPGHVAVVVQSENDQLLFLSDTVLHPIHLEHPTWQTSFDMDQQRSAASKRTIADMAAADRMRVLAFHFHPFPSLGAIGRHGSGWAWEPDVR